VTQPAATTQPAAATMPATTQAGTRETAIVPNALLCTVTGWATETSSHPVSQHLLRLAPKLEVTQQRTASTAAAQRRFRPRTINAERLVRPVCSMADLEGMTVSDLVEGFLRECSRAEYVQYMQRKDRLLNLTWAEDFPKVLLSQCGRWGVRPAAVREGALPQADLSVLKGVAGNEFELHRLEEDYAALESERASAFTANLLRGPQPHTLTPVAITIPAELGTYDFDKREFGLSTPLVEAALPLKAVFALPGKSFDARVVLLWEKERWLAPGIPLPAQTAEKLRVENPHIVMMLEGYVYYPNRNYANLYGHDVARSVFVFVSKAVFAACPDGKAPYEITTIKSTARPF